MCMCERVHKIALNTHAHPTHVLYYIYERSYTIKGYPP